MAGDGPGFKVVSFLLCDDVRQEKSGKETLIGVYGRDVIVKEFPAKVPQLAMRIVLEVEVHFTEFKLSITLPSKKKLVEVTGTGEAPNLEDWVHIPIKFGGAEFPEAGTYVVHVALDGRRRKAGQFNVRLPKSDEERGRLGVAS